LIDKEWKGMLKSGMTGREDPVGGIKEKFKGGIGGKTWAQCTEKNSREE